MATGKMVLRIKLLLLSLFRLKSVCGYPSLVRRFSYKDIKKATDGFLRVTDDSGYRGGSYKAIFQDGSVAMVKEHPLSDVDDESFYKEVQVLACLHHRHVVTLSGFSMGARRFLVFENMERGSLKEHLSDPLRTPLNWRTRLQIASGIAAAVEYLHFFCDPPIYRVRISSSTIMLDEEMIPKFSDVTLSNGYHSNEATPSCSCSRECKGQDCKDMVFRLGLVILELLTGQSSDKGGVDLVQWIQDENSPQSVHKMIDPDLGNNYEPRELRSLLNVARLCIRSLNMRTVSTSRILWFLQKKISV